MITARPCARTHPWPNCLLRQCHTCCSAKFLMPLLLSARLNGIHNADGVGVRVLGCGGESDARKEERQQIHTPIFRRDLGRLSSACRTTCRLRSWMSPTVVVWSRDLTNALTMIGRERVIGTCTMVSTVWTLIVGKWLGHDSEHMITVLGGDSNS